MQSNDVTTVNEACAAVAKVARRSIESHEARIADLKRLITLVEQIGSSDADEPNDELTADILRTALERVDREDQRATGKSKASSILPVWGKVVGRSE